jgi:hypothetical protein
MGTVKEKGEKTKDQGKIKGKRAKVEQKRCMGSKFWLIVERGKI